MAWSHVTEFSDQRSILAMKRTALVFRFCLEGNLQEMYLLGNSHAC